jgi:peptidoglycan/xylan/chitin deacetylase (PgdA/CDA1 family)
MFNRCDRWLFLLPTGLLSVLCFWLVSPLFISSPVQAQTTDWDNTWDSDWSDEPLDNAEDAEDGNAELALCDPNLPATEVSVATVTSRLLNVAQWVNQPQDPLEVIIRTTMPPLLAQLNPSPWPTIHERAAIANVPVMMYHDILPEKEVFFDVTPEEFEADLQLIRDNGLTPISMDQLVNHLRTGLPLPEKPILLTFDDGYIGHYEHVLPLLREYGYPGLFSIYTFKVGRDHGRPGVNWEQVQEMANDPLVTIAAHSVNHPRDLTELPVPEARREIAESKRELEERLGIPIRYFTYPEGNYDDRVAQLVEEAGFAAALTMNDMEDFVAGESESLLAIARLGQSRLEDVIDQAWGGAPLRPLGGAFDFSAPVQKQDHLVDDLPLTLITGGQPVTIHADSRYQVSEIMAMDTGIKAAVDGGFFSMEFLDSNQMIGPVFSQNTGTFVPGDRNDIAFIANRPLVLIGPDQVKFTEFDPDRHNSLEGVQAEMAAVTDAFVAAAWLVRDGQPQPPEAFGDLFDFDAERHRAFWGINQQGQPVVGVTHYFVDSIRLGEILAGLGLQDVVMLDSGASTSLAHEGESLMGYEPRPVPHIVGLIDHSQPVSSAEDCAILAQGLDATR